MAARRDSRIELLTAVAHEVGNLLAAVRLSAHLLPHAAEARERARGARQIEQLAAQAGELLAQVRPLLAARPARGAVPPSEVLDGVRGALADAPGAERLDVRAAPRGLPDVRAAPRSRPRTTVARWCSGAAAAGAASRSRSWTRAARSKRRGPARCPAAASWPCGSPTR
jgi:hypothetical protein